MGVIVFLALGAIIGSFLNVVALRLRTGVGVRGRSMCMSCGKALAWYELVPVASFVAQRGRCRGCRARISWQYPLVEAGVALSFALAYARYGLGWELLLVLAAISVLVVITVYDARHKIIPDGCVWLFDALTLALALTVHLPAGPHLWTILAGPLLAAPFALLWLVSRGRWIGLGDAKLLLGIGWLLGLNGGANAVILACWTGAAVGIVWMFAKHHGWKRGAEIPFGPFLILGTLLVLLFGLHVVDFRVLGLLF